MFTRVSPRSTNWTIPNFAHDLNRIDNNICLPSYSAPVKYHLHISTYSDSTTFTIYPSPLNEAHQTTDVDRCQVYIRQMNGNKFKVLDCILGNWTIEAKVERQFLLDPANGLLLNSGALLLQLDVFPAHDSENVEKQSCLSLFEHWRALLTSGDFSDVTVVVGGKSFALHKNILARSPVLKRMFQSEFIEAKEGKVKIDDVEVEVFEEFVRYLYTGDVNMEKHIFDMLALGEKYELEQLKCLCSEWLASNLNINSAACFLLFADLYNEAGLKDKCLTFISKNLKAVRATDGWKEFIKKAERIDLLEEVLAKMDL